VAGWVGVDGLLADGTDVGGLRLDDGTTVEADLVVVAGGRNSPVLDWIAELGGAVQPVGGTQRPRDHLPLALLPAASGA
jgi:glycine/D-amino acid oxidase-like deaminating enzyme